MPLAGPVDAHEASSRPFGQETNRLSTQFGFDAERLHRNRSQQWPGADRGFETLEIALAVGDLKADLPEEPGGRNACRGLDVHFPFKRDSQASDDIGRKAEHQGAGVNEDFLHARGSNVLLRDFPGKLLFMIQRVADDNFNFNLTHLSLPPSEVDRLCSCHELIIRGCLGALRP